MLKPNIKLEVKTECPESDPEDGAQDDDVPLSSILKKNDSDFSCPVLEPNVKLEVWFYYVINGTQLRHLCVSLLRKPQAHNQFNYFTVKYISDNFLHIVFVHVFCPPNPLGTSLTSTF